MEELKDCMKHSETKHFCFMHGIRKVRRFRKQGQYYCPLCFPEYAEADQTIKAEQKIVREANKDQHERRAVKQESQQIIDTLNAFYSQNLTGV